MVTIIFLTIVGDYDYIIMRNGVKTKLHYCLSAACEKYDKTGKIAVATTGSMSWEHFKLNLAVFIIIIISSSSNSSSSRRRRRSRSSNSSSSSRRRRSRSSSSSCRCC